MTDTADRKRFEEWMVNVEKIVVGSRDPYPAGMEAMLWRAWQAALASRDDRASEARGYTTGHCENHKKPGGCPMHNLQCGYPDCDRRPATAQPEARGEFVRVPREPTDRMESEGAKAMRRGADDYARAGLCYAAMLSAAPQPPGDEARYSLPLIEASWTDAFGHSRPQDFERLLWAMRANCEAAAPQPPGDNPRSLEWLESASEDAFADVVWVGMDAGNHDQTIYGVRCECGRFHRVGIPQPPGDEARDAARYRWLKGWADRISVPAHDIEWRSNVRLPWGTTDDSLDAAIDAAIAAGGEEG